MTDDQLRALVTDEADHLVQLARELPLGSVLERVDRTTAIRRVGLTLQT